MELGNPRSLLILALAAYGVIVALHGDDVPRALDLVIVVVVMVFLIEHVQALNEPSVPDLEPPYLGEDDVDA